MTRGGTISPAPRSGRARRTLRPVAPLASVPPSPRLGARELGMLVAGSLLLAVAMFWPLVLELGSSIPKDLGDPLAQAWQLAWDGHALIDQPGTSS